MNATTILLFILGLGTLVVGAEWLVRGAARLAAALGVSPLVIGLTVVAFGTSFPELAVSVQAAWSGQADLALGNVVGSNIFNVLFILGGSALLAPLSVAPQLLRLDVPLMVVASGLALIVGRDGAISRLDGALFLCGLLAYTLWLIRSSRRTVAAQRADRDAADARPPGSIGQTLLDVVLIVGGLTLLVLGSRWLVQGAVAIATLLGVSQLVIGLTVVAVGTSLPEVAASFAATVRGQRDIAIGNVVGSNIFNILAVLGGSALVSHDGVPVSAAVFVFDLPVMLGTAVACLPVFYTGRVISRGEGALFLAFYVLYTAYLILDATQYGGLATFRAAMLWFVVPLSAAMFTIASVRQFFRGTDPADEQASGSE